VRPAAVRLGWLVAALGVAGGLRAEVPAAEAIAGLEARLARADRVVFSFSTVSTGAFESTLDGRAVLCPDRLEVAADGRFGGEPASPHMRQHGGQLSGGNGERRFEMPAPAATGEALLVGWMRMGILHNLARLTAGQPPDHAEGGAAGWVTLHDSRWGKPGVRDGLAVRPLHFSIRVDGEDSGEATLWVGEDGLPVEREQTVRFPGGEMRVVERYRGVLVAESP